MFQKLDEIADKEFEITKNIDEVRHIVNDAKWKKLSFNYFSCLGVYQKDDTTVIIIDGNDKAFVMKDSERKFIHFIEEVKELIDEIKNVFSNPAFKHELGIDVWGYEVRFYINKGKVEISKKFLEKLIEEFMNSNYERAGEDQKLKQEAKEIEKFFNVKIEFNREKDKNKKVIIKVSGRTYNIKEQLKKLKYFWDKESKVWWKKGNSKQELLEELYSLLKNQLSTL